MRVDGGTLEGRLRRQKQGKRGGLVLESNSEDLTQAMMVGIKKGKTPKFPKLVTQPHRVTTWIPEPKKTGMEDDSQVFRQDDSMDKAAHHQKPLNTTVLFPALYKCIMIYLISILCRQVLLFSF